MNSVHEEDVRHPPEDPLKIDHSEIQDITTSLDTESSNSMPREDAAPASAEKTSNVTAKPGQSLHSFKSQITQLQFLVLFVQSSD